MERNAMWLCLHPLCAACERADKVTAAVEVDHCIAIADGGADDETNLQSLCRPCHVAKTNRERARRRGQGVGGEGRDAR